MNRFTADAAVGPFLHVCLGFLAIGAVGKLRTPLPAAQALVAAGSRPTRGLIGVIRVISLVELAAAVVGIGPAVRAGAAVAALLFVIFAGVIASAMTRGVVDCGCIGGTPSPPDLVHLGVNLLCAAVAGVAAWRGAPTLWSVVSEGPVVGLGYVLCIGCGAWLVSAVVTHRAVLARLVAVSASARAAATAAVAAAVAA